MRTKRWFLTTLMVLAPMIAACGTDDGDDTAGSDGSDSLTVVATTTMLGDIVKNVVGDAATVEVLMPVGADPHDFQASSQQVSVVSTADLVVANGLGLEEGLHDVLEGAEADGAHVLEVGDMVDPLPFGERGHSNHEAETAESCNPVAAHEHDEGEPEEGEHKEDDQEADEDETHDEEDSCDPHIWMDPIRMADAARLIAAELEAIAPDQGWDDRAETFATELLATNEHIEEMLAAVSEDARVMVTNHEAFGYFAELYGFEVVGTVIPGGSTLADPSSAELAELVDVIVDEGVPAIFTDSSAPSALAESIAEEAGSEVAVIELYSGSLGEPGSGADTLIGMLTTNAANIAEALS